MRVAGPFRARVKYSLEIEGLGWLLATEIVLILQGAYSQIFQAEAAREMAARFGGGELCYVAVAVASMAWVASACAASAFLWRRDATGASLWAVVLCGLSPIAALGSYAFAAGGPPLFDQGGCPGFFSVGEMLAYCALSPLFFGVLNGALFGSICALLGRERGAGAYAADALGAMLGGLLFSFVLAALRPPMSLLALAGAILPAAGFFICVRGVSSLFKRALCCLHCVVCVAFLSFLGTLDVQLASLKWSRLLPGYSYEGAVENASGRVEFLKDLRGRETRLAIYRDGALEAVLPKEREPELPTALFSVAQIPRENLRVLLVCSPFSTLPESLAALPVVAHVDYVCPDRELLELSRSMNLLPEDSAKFSGICEEPRRFLEGSGDSYDLVIVMGLRPDTLGGNRLFTKEFYESVAARLSRDGVFVSSMDSASVYASKETAAFNGCMEATLRSVFPKMVFTPGNTKLFAAGNGPLCASFDELDGRLALLMPAERSFPQGLMGVVFSQAEQKAESLSVAQASIGAPLNRDLEPELPYLHLERQARVQSGDIEDPGFFIGLLEFSLCYWKEFLMALALFYAFFRYLLSSSMSRKTLFLSFENGCYASGLVMLLLFLHQTRCGALYRDLAAASGLFMGGAALGAILGCRKLWPFFARPLRWGALLLPLGAPFIVFLPWGFAYGGVFVALALGGLATGYGYAVFNAESGAENPSASLWGAELLGGAFGALALTLLVLPSAGFVGCAVALALIRLPFAMGK